jgi:hypothetical protein
MTSTPAAARRWWIQEVTEQMESLLTKNAIFANRFGRRHSCPRTRLRGWVGPCLRGSYRLRHPQKEIIPTRYEQ